MAKSSIFACVKKNIKVDFESEITASLKAREPAS
jgi:hypothetical protein